MIYILGRIIMEYKYAANDNYEDFSSGRVIYHMGGAATFPVRLALEIYERCLQYSKKKKDILLYDCCCGGAYMLTVLGLLKGDTISDIYGSDVDQKSLKLAEDNLSLLSYDGLRRRRQELEELYKKFGKNSHLEALESVDRLEKRISTKINTQVFYRNAFEEDKLPFIPDIIITDVPYGNMVEWSKGSGDINQMVESLSKVCGSETILCISMDKKQKIQTELFKRLEKQMIGKRKFEIYIKKE